LARFLYGLGIRHVGVQTAVDLANNFRSIEAITNASIDELLKVEGIGQVVSEAVLTYFTDPVNAMLLQKFRDNGVWPQEVKVIDRKLSGINFVVSGTLANMSREEAAEAIRNLGGTFQSSVAKDTSYLVVGDKPGFSKVAKAKSFNIATIDETAFLQLLTS
jgi:DNA ligase (NAD+)